MYKENHRIVRWFRKAYSFTEKNSFVIKKNDDLQKVIKNNKGILKWIRTHYHTRRGIASTTLYSPQNIEEKYFMGAKD